MGNNNTYSADVVVIGGGPSGLAAGVSAAEHGAHVIVLEKNAAPGGSAIMAGGLFAAESEVQKRAGISVSREISNLVANQHSHHRADPILLREFIDGSADVIAWLEGQGLTFIPFKDESEGFGGFPAGGFHLPKGAGIGLTKHLAAQCEQFGGEIWRKSAATAILLENNCLAGVRVSKDGEDATIHTDKVIIATGGFGGNIEKCQERCPDYKQNMTCYGMHNSGDGIRLAEETGAELEDQSAMLLVGPTQPKSVCLRIETNTEPLNMQFSTLLTEPNTLWVNTRGKRFCNEFIGCNHFESANAVLVQPGNEMYALFDSAIVDDWSTNGFLLGFGAPLQVDGKKMPGLEKAIMAHESNGLVKRADTLEELADWIGVDAQVLKSTVEQYNDCCDNEKDHYLGKDEKFLNALRKPPYYAAKGRTDFLNTIGGIRINERLEAQDIKGRSIPGLYAVGADASGWCANFYNGYIPGNAIGFCVYSGRAAGKNAALSK